MKAVRIHRFGPPDVISLDDVPKPEPGRGEVVVRVNAAGIGPWDALIRSGKSVLPQPFPLILGSDLSGEVDSLGAGVANLKVDDEVFLGRASRSSPHARRVFLRRLPIA
jgi:NADPH:quinone reductase-like Zn-dependent oxidoreductase